MILIWQHSFFAIMFKSILIINSKVCSLLFKIYLQSGDDKICYLCSGHFTNHGTLLWGYGNAVFLQSLDDSSSPLSSSLQPHLLILQQPAGQQLRARKLPIIDCCTILKVAPSGNRNPYDPTLTVSLLYWSLHQGHSNQCRLCK